MGLDGRCCVVDRKANVLLMLLLLIGVPSWAVTIHVPGDHPTIQQAVGTALDGDTVLVAPGKYDGVVELRDGITLQGAGSTTRLSQTIKAVDVQRVMISSLRVQGIDENSHFGIFCIGADVQLHDVTVQDFHHGISAENTHLTVQSCEIVNGFNVGIILTQDTEALVESTTILSSAAGIIVSATGRLVILRNNRIEGNNVGVECHDANPRLRQNIITDNFLGMTIDHASPDLGTEADPGGNSIVGNQQAGIRYTDKQTLLAQLNWWGQATGPSPEQIEGRVSTEPWLTADPQESRLVSPGSAMISVLWGNLKAAAFTTCRR